MYVMRMRGKVFRNQNIRPYYFFPTESSIKKGVYERGYIVMYNVQIWYTVTLKSVLYYMLSEVYWYPIKLPRNLSSVIDRV